MALAHRRPVLEHKGALAPLEVADDPLLRHVGRSTRPLSSERMPARSGRQYRAWVGLAQDDPRRGRTTVGRRLVSDFVPSVQREGCLYVERHVPSLSDAWASTQPQRVAIPDNEVQAPRGTPYPPRVTASSVDLADLGWDEEWQTAFAPFADEAIPGRVVRVDRGLCRVLTHAGVVRASLGGGLLEEISHDSMTAPCTGDWCAVRHWSDGPSTLEAVLARRTAVTRADSKGTSRGQVLAANIDVVAIVVALHPEPNLARVERFLSLAWQSGGMPVVLLTKADLVGDADHIAHDVRRFAPGVPVVPVSTVSGEGMDAVAHLVQGGKTMVLLGVSGHGKSSLTNALLGADVLAIKDIRADGKGRHTSVRRELLLVPGGGAVIDTPGLRGVGLQDSAEGIAATFPDVEELVDACRFFDCAHASEPGCAVQAALTDGTLSSRRLESWQALQREQRWMATRASARLRSEQQQKWKQLSRDSRKSRRARR